MKIICVTSLTIFIILLMGLFTNNLILLDNKIYDLIINTLSIDIYKSITFLASPIFLIALTLIFLFTKNGLSILFNLLNVTILNNLLKIVIRRDRPVGINLVLENGFSFPSGHAMIGLAFYGLIIYFIYKSKLKYKNYLIILFSILILLIGISRIYLGVHYASDVIAGYSISIIYLSIFIKKIYPKIKEWSILNR